MVVNAPISDWVSLRELARRRGRTLRAVQKMVARGQIPGSAVRREHGRIKAVDAAVALQCWAGDGAAGGRLAQLARAKSPHVAPSHAADAAPARGKHRGGERDPYRDKARADAERAQFAAQNERLDFEERRERLIDRDETNQENFAWWRRVRDRIRNVPSHIAPILAAESDPARCHAIVLAEIDKTLCDLADAAVAQFSAPAGTGTK